MNDPAARPSSTGESETSRSAMTAASVSVPLIDNRRARPHRLAIVTPSVAMVGSVERAADRISFGSDATSVDGDRQYVFGYPDADADADTDGDSCRGADQRC